MPPPAVARLSRVWFPTGGIAVPSVEDAHSKLIRAGLLRQSNAGMFHILPLGRRVQDKIESLVAGHMEEHLGRSLWPSHKTLRCERTEKSTLWLTNCFYHRLQTHLESPCLPSRRRHSGNVVADWRMLPPRFVLF